MNKLLLIRNDKLGDFILAIPAFALLKQSAPHLHLTALVPEYTADIARICPYLDDIIIDAGKHGQSAERHTTLKAIRNGKFDGVISFFSNTYNGLLVWKSNIPYRMAPATKIAQLCYNHRIRQRRSYSKKPEFEYNLDLARTFLQQHNITPQEPQPPYLYFDPQIISEHRNKLTQQLGFPTNVPLIFIHSGSGGSANNLSLSQYAALIDAIVSDTDAYIVLTAGPNETPQATELYHLSHSSSRTAIYESKHGLADFALSTATANVFIAGSTGTLHLAAALNRPTIGFFPSRLGASPLRWQPINDTDKHLAFTPPNDTHDTQNNLNLININRIWHDILPFIQTHIETLPNSFL